MKVSELARLAGVAPTAVRFYEAQGVIPSPRRAPNGYREYSEADLCRLRLVVALRGLGIEVAESGRLAAMCTAGQCEEMSTSLQDRLVRRRREIAAARAELDHLDAELANLQRMLSSGESVRNLCIEEGESDGAAV